MAQKGMFCRWWYHELIPVLSFDVSVEARNGWPTAPLPVCLHVAYCWIKHRDNFTFVLLYYQILPTVTPLSASYTNRHNCYWSFGMKAIHIVNLYTANGARGSVVGWGTMLQVGRSRTRFPMRSLDFLIDLILTTSLWPWGRLSLWQN
jgi:hypothetical protein